MFTGNPQHRNKLCCRDPFRSWQFRTSNRSSRRKKKKKERKIGCGDPKPVSKVPLKSSYIGLIIVSLAGTVAGSPRARRREGYSLLSFLDKYMFAIFSRPYP